MPETVIVSRQIIDLIPRFLHNRRRDVEVMREALREKDFRTLNERGEQMRFV